jgi:hypothetical protein
MGRASGDAQAIRQQMDYIASFTGKTVSVISSAWLVMIAWRTHLPIADIQLVSGSQLLNTAILSALGAVIGGVLGYLINKLMRWLDKKFFNKK